MAYNSLNKAHTHHAIHTEDGSEATAYNRYQTGVIAGRYRDVPAVIADESGFDGLGFDSMVDSEDDRWHMVNVFKQGGHYIDSLAIGGAYDEHQAMQVATTQLDYLGGDYCKFVTDSQNVQFDDLSAPTVDTWSIDAVNKLMDNPSQDQHYLPTVTAQELQTEASRVSFDSVQWDNLDNLVSHGGKAHLLSLDLIRADTRNELVTPFVLADELRDTNAVAASFDALMDAASRLPLLKDRLFRAMADAGKGNDVTVENVTQTKDFKRQGVINSAFVFDLSDGQTLSIWFHNPDSTPSKLLPSDIMISWKWMLNKRDVTAALSPKNGDNVQLPALAKRILRLAATNSKRFKSAQARTAKADQELTDAQAAVSRKNDKIERLDSDIESLHFQIDTRMKAATDKAAATPSPDDVNNNDDLPSLTIDSPPARPTNGSITEGNISVGDPIVWRTENNTGNVNEIKGTFKSFMDHQGELRVSFMSEGSQLGAPQSEVFADTDAPAATDDTPAKPAKKEKKAKTYPPVEHQGEGVYIAYKNSKKKDTWSASQLDDGTWQVFADNAQTRAYQSSKPKHFKSVESMIAQYPAFKGIEALIAQNIATATDTDTTDYSTEHSADFDAYTITVTEGENVGKTYNYAEVVKSPELQDRFNSSVFPLQSSRIDNIKALLVDGNDWELRSEFEGDDELDGVIKEGVEAIPTLNSNTPPAADGIPPEQDYYDRLIVWTIDDANFKFVDDLSLSDKAVADMIEKAYATNDENDDADDADEYDAVDSSEYPSLFLARNADSLQVLGIDDDAIQVNDRGQYVIEKGMFADMTLAFADTVCKLVQAADDNDSQIAVADFNASAYQDSMFDALTSKSKPTYGITAQITKDNLNIRARVDEAGECEILLGTSGKTVNSTVKTAFTDNTVAYKDAIQESFFKQSEIDMQTENQAKTADDVTVPAPSTAISKVPSRTGITKQTSLAYIKSLLDMAKQDWVPTVTIDDLKTLSSDEALKYRAADKKNLEDEKAEVLKNVGGIFHNVAYKKDKPEVQELGNQIDRAYSGTKWGEKPSQEQQLVTYWSDLAREYEKVTKAAAPVATPVVEPTPEPVAPTAPVVEPAVPAKSLADRIAVVMDNVTSKDFDPTSIDTEALLGLVDEAKDDKALTAEIETLTKIYQRKLVEISMKALASLADDV